MSLVKTYARIEELEQENAQLRLQIDMLKMERENDCWIPCSERMPEIEEDVTVTIENENGERFTDIWNAYYNGNCWQWSGTYSTVECEIISWRPLPEPYKGDADATKQ